MNSIPFAQELQARIAKYDLLSHPFYNACRAGEVSRDGWREKACRYFALHTTAELYHAHIWRQQLEERVESNPGATEKALDAAEAAAGALWRALDGIEAMRLTPTA